MTTKFNKDMYARMRGKKDEPLSAIGTKSVRITDRGVPILSALPSSPTLAPARGASPTPSVEEVPPRNIRLRAGEKQKEKVVSRPSCFWDNAGVSVARAQETSNGLTVWLGNHLRCLLILNDFVPPSGVISPFTRQSHYRQGYFVRDTVCSSVLSTSIKQVVLYNSFFFNLFIYFFFFFLQDKILL